MRSAVRAAAAALVLCAGSAHAQSLGLQFGSTGLGAEAAYAPGDHFGIRGSYGTGSFAYEITESGIRYDTKLKPRVALATLDLHPFAGVFRLSAGLGWNGSKIVGNADTVTGTIVINGVAYDTSQIGTVDGEVTFRKSAPYIGFGWGTAPGSKQAGLYFSSDFGVLYSPATGRVTGTCAPFLAPPVCAALQSDLRAEALDFSREVERHKYYPVIRVGVGYRF